MSKLAGIRGRHEHEVLSIAQLCGCPQPARVRKHDGPPRRHCLERDALPRRLGDVFRRHDDHGCAPVEVADFLVGEQLRVPVGALPGDVRGERGRRNLTREDPDRRRDVWRRGNKGLPVAMAVVADRQHLARLFDLAGDPEIRVDSERHDVHPLGQAEPTQTVELARAVQHRLHAMQQRQSGEPARAPPGIVEQARDDSHERLPQPTCPAPRGKRHRGARRGRDDDVGGAELR